MNTNYFIERAGIRRSAGCMLMAARSGRFLFCYRSANSPSPNTWAPWGGKCEYGEYPEVAARRELFEETGLEYTGELSHLHHYELKGHSFDTYLAVVPEEFVPELREEAEKSDWFDIDELPQPLHDGLADLMESRIATGLLYKAVTGLSGRPCKLR